MKYMQRWEEMEMEKDEARAEGRAEGLSEGRAEGLSEGRNSMAKLMDKLLEANRVNDCKRAVKDPEYCQTLMDELGIK